VEMDELLTKCIVSGDLNMVQARAFPARAKFWVESELQAEIKRKHLWSESIAIGSERFVESAPAA